jgi:hypothetical protein
MKINIKEIQPTIKIVTNKKYPDLLAYVSLRFIEEHERHFTVNGFTIRTSKYNHKPYLVPPSKSMSSKGFYKFVLVEESLWKKIEKTVIREYEYQNIPIIEDKKK